MTEPTNGKKEIRCRGRIEGTNEKCNRVLGRTDGKTLYFKIDEYETEIELKRRNDSFPLKCGKCGYVETFHTSNG